MRLVIALGGNALLKRGEALTAENQRRNMHAAAAALAKACAGAEVVIVHGNGPQVGLLALEAHAYPAAAQTPLDVLGAESQGMIGYVIAQELGNAMPGRPVAAMITQTVVDAADPAFAKATKPIGPVYAPSEAEALQAELAWTFAPDGSGMRRVVASPRPVEIVELSAIEGLVSAGTVVVCAGGGGIPVRRGRDGSLLGVEAVIDKDMTAALLAQALGADRFLILTDVDAVYLDWATPKRRPIRKVAANILREIPFEAGSMGPKVAAACEFAERTGRPSIIGSMSALQDVLAGRAGTVVHP
jgi:carbamate kinase